MFPKQKTLKQWNDKYPDEMETLFDLDIASLPFVLPQELRTLSEKVIYNYLLQTQSNRLVLYNFENNTTKDIETINKMKKAIMYRGASIAHKYKFLDDIIYTNWDYERAELLLQDYTIEHLGSYTDNEHTYTSQNGVNQVTNKRSDTQQENKVYTYEGTEVSESKSTTNSQKNPTAYESQTDSAFDYNKDRTRTYTNYKEQGHRRSSFIEDFPKILELLNINVMDEYLKDVMPVFMYYIYK